MKKRLLSYCCTLSLLLYASWGQASFNEPANIAVTVNNVQNLNTMSNFGTIQAAVDAATAGDVLEVGDGVYNENVIIDKSLTLQSINGRASTIIQGSDNGILGTILISSGVNNVTHVTHSKLEP
jgi:pectin methylesterase-like acyl-CoA thioesterase